MLMHHHTVGAFCFDSIPVPRAQALLATVAQERRLVGSAFAESRNVDLLDSSVVCTPEDGGFRIDGCKKPCTISHHADLFLVGVIDREGPEGSRGLAFVERKASRILVEPFWSQDVLRATGSESLRFEDTRVPADNVLLPTPGREDFIRQRFAVAQSEITISMIFQVLMASSYLGAAAQLCTLAIAHDARDGDDALMFLACELEAARFAQYRLAQRMDGGGFSTEQLGQAMALSYNAIRRLDALITEIDARPRLLEHEECLYLRRVCSFMKRHPPSEAVRRGILANCYLPA
jgi:alkylation response protein AidB-like acyl-CoA dehydrogenase